jgi:hypothetical protein
MRAATSSSARHVFDSLDRELIGLIGFERALREVRMIEGVLSSETSLILTTV